jgi:anaerobic magnesium-protoporphyrin IX monomethyl ester cyclase
MRAALPAEALEVPGPIPCRVVRGLGHPWRSVRSPNLREPAPRVVVSNACRMRIALLYPPPWQMPGPGGPSPPPGEGPPEEYQDGDIDADFFQLPYGLLTLAAVCLKAKHQVKVLNLSAFSWPLVERVLSELEADVFGISAYTANRRGVASVAQLIRARHPGAHVVVGGPHATALAREHLAHYPAIDTVVVGEGEVTLLELLARLGREESLVGLPGAVYRCLGRVERGPDRAPLRDLDTLPSPHQHFTSHLVMTSRGCPWHCSFCAAKMQWGRKLRHHSVPYVLECLEQALERVSVKMLLFKDDTFTAHRRRSLEFLGALRARDLRFAWSCDTRADALDAELVRELRLAGCQRVSLGVESGSPTILRQIEKQARLEAVWRATQLCKEVGIQVRFFMMLGNRGETATTFRESLDFVHAVRPHQVLFACLSVYPGSRDYHDLVARGELDSEDYFTRDFQELKRPFDASAEDTQLLGRWFQRNRGVRELYREGVAEHRSVLARVGEHWGVYLDLAGAYFRAGELGRSAEHVRRALELGHPCPGLGHNYLACIRAREHDWEGMEREFELALGDPQHRVLALNRRALAAWREQGGRKSGTEPRLMAGHDFEILERPLQPVLPGPLPDDFAQWSHDPQPSGESL